MTKQEAKATLQRDLTNVTPNTLLTKAINIAIQALTDPEWIPNTGTKPECALCYVRMGDGEIDKGRPNEWDWSCRIRPDGRITHYIPIPDPPEFVEKRRYVVEVSVDKTKVGAFDNKRGQWVGYPFDNNAKGNEAAQSIADIYEGMNEETK